MSTVRSCFPRQSEPCEGVRLRSFAGDHQARAQCLAEWIGGHAFTCPLCRADISQLLVGHACSFGRQRLNAARRAQGRGRRRRLSENAERADRQEDEGREAILPVRLAYMDQLALDFASERLHDIFESHIRWCASRSSSSNDCCPGSGGGGFGGG